MQQTVDDKPDGHNAVSPVSVLWVTNLAAPYRRPVWRELARRHELTVALLESDQGLASDTDSNRGLDWLHAGDEQLTFKELSTWKVSRGESRYYVLKSIFGAMSARKYDVVLFGGWESPAYWLLLLVCVIFGTARVGFYESPQNTMTHKAGPVAALRTVFFRSMTRVIVPGNAAYDAIVGLGVSPHRIHRGFNAVDVTSFHEAALTALSENADAGRTGHRYIYVGQLIERKRVQEIVQTFISVARPEDRLTIVGTGHLREELTDLAKESPAQISFLGQVSNSDLPRIMAVQDTLILASNREVWGLVVNEALASGMHVVVTENCGVSRSVNGMRGVLVVQENLEDLAQMLKASRTSWAGRIQTPEILEYTPSRFADVFDQAFVAAYQEVTTKKTGGRKACASNL